MATPNYEIDPNNKELKDVKADEHEVIKENDRLYNKAIGNLDDSYNKQLDVIETEKNTLTKNQNAAHEFAIEKIEQGKEQAHKNYIKEQSAAYMDYQRQIDPYGVTAETMAANGLKGTGWAESSKVAMYNSYQNRIATARAAFELTKQGYDNQMTEARLQNSSILGEIALNALKAQTELIITTSAEKSKLVLEQAKAKREIKSDYYNRYMQVVSKIIEENKLKEEARQFDATMAEERRQFDILHPATTGLTVKGGSSGGSGGGSGGSKSSGGSSSSGSVNKTSAGSGSTSNSSSSGATIDMDSVLSLGYGPISASKLNQLVAEGKAVKYVENGKIKFKKTVKLPTSKHEKSSSTVKSYAGTRGAKGMVFGSPVRTKK